MAFVVEAEKTEVFHIDDLLDFSCEDIGGPIVGAGELELSGVTVDSCCEATSISSSGAELPLEDIDEAKTDLCVPCDDLADLEWLSSFVEDSFAVVEIPEVSSTYGSFPSALERTPNVKLYQQSSPVSVLESSPASSELTGSDYTVPVPGRARSKRSRTGARIWTSKILSTSSSVSSFESECAMSYSPTSIGSEDDSTVDDEEDEEDEDSQSSRNSNAKGRKKCQDNGQAWRCLHCQTQRTPQWRTGPMGPKTLCNACGVRYKSGRLLPEYRPAGSPTYVASKHSHSHKKVLEMRRERELRGQSQGMHPQSIHGATPLREKTNHVQQQQQQKDVKSEYQCYNSKCFSKPLELPRSKPLELPKYSNMSFPRLEFL